MGRGGGGGWEKRGVSREHGNGEGGRGVKGWERGGGGGMTEKLRGR